MYFATGTYLVFLMAVFFGYWASASRTRLRVAFLTAASCFFYSLMGICGILLLFAVSVVDFTTTRLMAGAQAHRRRRLLFISKGDHLFGLGGASFTAEKTGASAAFGTVDEGELGRLVSAFDLYFLAQPGGGDFEIDIDGVFQSRVATNSETVKSSFREVRVPEGSHRMTIKPAGNGQVRLFGVALESGRRGVEYDSLGINGAFIGLLAHYIDEQHWTEQLRHRQPDLVIIGYGANESQFERLSMDQYEKDTREVIRRIRSALPDVSILFVAPMDRGERGAGGKVVTRPMIRKLIAYQRRIAAENECGFFDTFTAMGGEGTAAKWLEARPRLMGGDFTHPTAQGAEIVGTLIYDAMMRAYDHYKERRLR